MNIEFIYDYVWTGETRKYHVVSDAGVVTVRTFTDGSVGSIVSPVPAGRMAEIDAIIASVIADLGAGA